jgi:hypothetical protein
MKEITAKCSYIKVHQCEYSPPALILSRLLIQLMGVFILEYDVFLDFSGKLIEISYKRYELQETWEV